MTYRGTLTPSSHVGPMGCGGAHGLAATHKDQLNDDLLAFIQS